MGAQQQTYRVAHLTPPHNNHTPTPPHSLSTFMAVEDWLGDWLSRRPPPPPDLLPPALDYARALLRAEEASEADGDAGHSGGSSSSMMRGQQRGTALERLLAHRPVSALLLGPDSLAAYGGPATSLAAARAVAAFTRAHVGLRRRLLNAPLGLWARLGQEEGTGASTWEPPPPPRGLRNHGNTCYMNSLLQQLAGLGPGVLGDGKEGGEGEDGVMLGAMTEEEAGRWAEDGAGQQLLGELVRSCFGIFGGRFGPWILCKSMLTIRLAYNPKQIDSGA